MVGWSWITVAGVFAFLALFLSIYEIVQHLSHYNKPYLQKYIIRVLWMVPIYTLNSFIAMRNPETAIYFDTLRECYEAFVIHCFMKYLINFLFREVDIDNVIDSKPRVKHVFPLTFLYPMPGGRRFLYLCKHLILQYAILRPITTFLALITQRLDVYKEDVYSFKYAFLYLLVINNISQMTAMYFLALFYIAYRAELSPMRPLLKFLVIKAVIFITFFQSVVISFLLELHIIPSSFRDLTKSEIARSYQDFLICIEMFLAALIHVFAFSHRPFIDSSAYYEPACYSFIRTLDFSDDRSDVYDHFYHIWNRIKTSWRTKQINPFHGEDIENEDVFIALVPTQSPNHGRTYSSTDNLDKKPS